jgi:hypothetical protein
MARSHHLTGEHAKACCAVGVGRAPLKFASAHHAAVLGSYASERSEGSSLRGADHRATTLYSVDPVGS